MSDFTVSVDFDASAILRGFAKLEQDAKAAGASAGKGLAEGLQGFSSKSITALQQELQRLTQRQLRVDVDSRAFTVTGERIRAVQAQLDSIQRKQVAIGVDSRSIVALQSKLQELQSRQVKVDVDSSEFIDLQRQINTVERELADIERKRVRIDVDANSITAITSKLQADLERLQQRQVRIDVDSQEFRDLGLEIDRIQDELAQVERKRVAIGVDDRSITALQSKLQALQAKQVRVDVDSQEFLDLQREINRTQAEIEKVERNRVLIDVDSNSVTALQTRLQGLQGELNKVAIGSQRFRELQGAIEDTQRELARAGESSDQFRLLDGVIQGVAFSLSNALIDGAGRALGAVGGLIGGFLRLDTVIRQAAAASGGRDDYAKLSATIDKVGVDAAGTTEEVAALSLELARGGMTADQQSKALMGIVRGAEATATSYDQMGKIVSATLTAFGLQASQTSRVVDALVQGANSSATDVAGLGEAFKTSAPAAKLLGVSVEGLATAVGLFTNAGITAGEAGTALRNGLSLIASAAPKAGKPLQGLTGQAADAAETIQKLGLTSIYTANGQLKPMEEVLIKLKQAFAGLTAGEQTQLASKLFGGLDDGAKWLALLTQTDEQIRTVAQSMANSKGATDRNRDAMDNLGMTLKQIGGTLDLFGKSIGRVAAGAITPFVNIAKSMIDKVAEVPRPVQDAVIAVGLLAGSIVGATLSLVVFQKALATTQVQGFVSGVVSIATAMRANLAGAATVAIVAVDKLIAGIKAFTVANVISSIQALATSLKATLSAGLLAAKQALVSFAVYLRSVSFASLIGSIGTAIATFGPFILAIAAVGAAVVAWQKLTGDANKVQKDFADLHKASAESTKTLEAAIGSLGNQTSKSTGQMMTMIEVLASWKAINQLVTEVNNLTASMDAGFNAALKFIGELNKGGPITDQNTAKAKAFTTALNEQIGVLQQALGAAKERLGVLEAGGRGNTKEAESLRASINGMEAEIRAREAAKEAILRKTVAQAEANGQNAADLNLTKEQIKFNQERAKTEEEINKVLREAPVRNLEAQLAVGQQLLNLAQAVGQAEQSRYAVTRSALGFELQQAEQRGASEQQIKAIKDQIAANDKAALEARYRQLEAEQALQRTMLQLSQEKARAEANVAVLEQRANILKAEAAVQEGNVALSKAKNEEERLAALSQIEAAKAQVGLQRQILGVREESVGLLAQTQPLERAALGFQQEAARNGLRAEAAAKGYRFALDGTLQPADKLAQLQGRIGTITKASAADQERYGRLAAQSGLAIGRAADGTVVLGRTQKDVNTAVDEMNRKLAGAKGGYDAAGRSAGQAKTATDGIRQALQSAGAPANQIVEFLDNAETNAKGVKSETDKLKTGLQQSATPASGIAASFVSTGKNAPAAAQGARDFASYLSSAKTFAERIANLNLGRAMATVANETNRAAGAAKTFYDWLLKASNLPGSRWTGGPVEAGGEYKINELGQEAFLSAGRLSLINAPANSVWRAPSDGVVIPAGMTAQLQARAAVEASGGNPGVAELAVEVGKLRAEVGNLARRDWSVHVQQRTGPTGSQVMRTLLS